MELQCYNLVFSILESPFLLIKQALHLYEIPSFTTITPTKMALDDG